MGSERVIVVRGTPIHVSDARANVAITPGQLLEFRIAGGNQGFLQLHSSSGGEGQSRFALENKITGEEITDDYASGETVNYAVFRKGDVVNAILATNQVIQRGERLMSDGLGNLTRHTGSNAVIAEASEDVTTGGSTARINAEIV